MDKENQPTPLASFRNDVDATVGELHYKNAADKYVVTLTYEDPAISTEHIREEYDTLESAMERFQELFAIEMSDALEYAEE